MVKSRPIRSAATPEYSSSPVNRAKGCSASYELWGGGATPGTHEVLELLEGSRVLLGTSLWTHPPARRQPDALGHKESSPCHPQLSSGPVGAWVPGGEGVVNVRSFVTFPVSPLSSPGVTSSRWPTSTKAQVGWKAPVPQASKWVWL